MSKYCPNCGAALEDDAVVCGKCGANFADIPQENAEPATEVLPQQPEAAPDAAPYAAPQQPDAAPYAAPQQDYPQQPDAAAPYGAPGQPAPEQPKKGMSKGMLFGIGGGAVALVIILCILLGALGVFKSGAEKAFKKGFAAYKDYNIQKMADVSYEPNFSNSLTKEEYVAQAETYLNSDPETYEKQKEKLKDASYSNLTVRKLDDQETAKLKESLADTYKDVGNIKEIDKIYFNAVIDNSAGASSCYAIKVGSKWYLYGVGLGI